MPPLDTANHKESGSRIAVMAEVLYLVNLLLLPGLAFVALMILYIRHMHSADTLGKCHLNQTVTASIWAGILIIIITAAILMLGGYDQAWTWVSIIIYFTTIHATLVLLGVVGLSRAMAGKHYHYPLIGRACIGTA